MLKTALFALAFCFAAAAESPQPLFDNERVTVRDATGPLPAAEHDFVAVSLSNRGTAFFGHKGETPGKDGSRNVVIELKDHAVAPLPNTSGYPNAFPRPARQEVV